MLSTLPQGDEVSSADGYIRVFQDIRGKYGSEGDYVMTRPLRGPLNRQRRRPLDRRLRHHRLAGEERARIERQGRHAGQSYEGFTVVMALINPHPALKVAAPMSPMVDGWMGDDWFHYGAFRQTNFDYFAGQTTAADAGKAMDARTATTTTTISCAPARPATSRKRHGMDQLPCVAARSPSIRPTTRSGRGRRSTKSWRRSR